MGDAPLAPIRTLQCPIRNRAKYLKINGSIHHLKGIAQIANPLKSFVQVKQASLLHARQQSHFTPKIQEFLEVSNPDTSVRT